MDSRIVWFVTESKEEQDRLTILYPGRVLLCDQTYIQDTAGSKKYVEGMIDLLEIRSAASTVPTLAGIVFERHVSRRVLKDTTRDMSQTCLSCRGDMSPTS